MLALCAELSWNIGMPACGVVSATVNAVPVIPGVVAISTNVSDFEFGEVYPARVA